MALILRFIQPCARIIYRIVNLLWNTAVNAYCLISWLLSSSDGEKEHQVSENADMEHPVKAVGWAARDTSGILSPFKFSRRATREHDVQFKILYCGICHSDLHQLKNDLGISSYPLVPGHEIVGVVTQVGAKVRKVKVGDKVGVGCMVGSCRKCDQCVNDLENYCPKPVCIARTFFISVSGSDFDSNF